MTTVTQLYRHPLKSNGREELDHTAPPGAVDAVEPDLGGGARRGASGWERMVALCKFEHRVKSTIWFDAATP